MKRKYTKLTPQLQQEILRLHHGNILKKDICNITGVACRTITNVINQHIYYYKVDLSKPIDNLIYGDLING